MIWYDATADFEFMSCGFQNRNISAFRDSLKVKVENASYSSEALRYGTRCQGITQFYLSHTRLSTNGMNHACLCLPSRSWSSFIDRLTMEGFELA